MFVKGGIPGLVNLGILVIISTLSLALLLKRYYGKATTFCWHITYPRQMETSLAASHSFNKVDGPMLSSPTHHTSNGIPLAA